VAAGQAVDEAAGQAMTYVAVEFEVHGIGEWRQAGGGSRMLKGCCCVRFKLGCVIAEGKWGLPWQWGRWGLRGCCVGLRMQGPEGKRYQGVP